MKARHGRYSDTAENRRLHRVGQEYGHAAQEEESSGKKAGKGEEGKEKRTYDTARKELSSVLSHKDEFIQKYGEDEYNKRVGALVAEAKTLRDTEHTAEADKDFDKLKQPEKPKGTRSKKEIRTERLAKYKEQLKKVQEKMNQEGESEESRKMGEALEAKWKAKIEKLEAKVNRGKKKEEPEQNPTEKKEDGIESSSEIQKEFDDFVEKWNKKNPDESKFSVLNDWVIMAWNNAYPDKFRPMLGNGGGVEYDENMPGGKELNKLQNNFFESEEDFENKEQDLVRKLYPVGREVPTEVVNSYIRKEKYLWGTRNLKFDKAKEWLENISPERYYHELQMINDRKKYDKKEPRWGEKEEPYNDKKKEKGKLSKAEKLSKELSDKVDAYGKKLDSLYDSGKIDQEEYEELNGELERWNKDFSDLFDEAGDIKGKEDLEDYSREIREAENEFYRLEDLDIYEEEGEEEKSSKGAEMIDESVDDPVTGRRVSRSAYVGTSEEMSKIDKKDLEKGLSGQVFELRTKGLQINFINTNGDGTSYKVGEWEGGEKAGWDGGGKPKRDVFGKGGARATYFQYSKEYNDTEISKYGSKGYDANRGIFRYKTKEEMIDGIKAYIQDVFKAEK